MCERTASHDRVLEWKTPTKELSVGQSGNRAGGTFTRKIALGHRLSELTSHLEPAVISARESSACDGGGEGGQGWDEGENPHSVWLSWKESVRVIK